MNEGILHLGYTKAMSSICAPKNTSLKIKLQVQGQTFHLQLSTVSLPVPITHSFNNH